MEHPLDALVQALKNGNPAGRVAAAEALGKTKGVQAVRHLVVALGDADPLVREAAAKALRQTEEGRTVMTFIEVTNQSANRY